VPDSRKSVAASSRSSPEGTPAAAVSASKSSLPRMISRVRERPARAGSTSIDPPPGTSSVPTSGCPNRAFSRLANRTPAAPGSAQGLFLIVSDIEAVRDALVAADIKVSEVFHPGPGGRVSGPAPEHGSYRSFASLSDPDGNGWLFQEVTTRLPGRVDPAATSFGSASDLAGAMRRASAAHGEHEKRIGAADANWPDWYADYMVAEQAGTELPT
jgi:hypothetical protein